MLTALAATLVGGSILITLLVLCIVIALAYWLITTLLPPPIQKYAIAVLVVICVIWLLSMLGVRLP